MILELRKLSLIAEGLLNEMIPFSSNKLLPRGSDAIKIDLFIGFLNNNKKIKNLLITSIPKNINDIENDKELIEIGADLSMSQELEVLIGDFLINSYFTSDLVLKLLSSRDTLDDIDYSEKLAKKKILKYLKKN
jgi:hypothetical protein|tara:strand:+ start:1552 stop:1953 length:402 start_codon:yes stop_codon:yes gene_type:complete